ncbi:MAG: ABC-three component system protein [Pseudomonadota bacterium]
MTLDPVQRTHYGYRFELDFLKAQAQAFEDLFNRIMAHRYQSDFQPVRAYGNQGDKKSDGYLTREKTVFQCYGPKTTKQSEMLAKIDDDYAGARKHWGERMRRWRFVHNDHEGLPPDVVQRLTDLNNNDDPVDVDAFGYAELRERVFELTLQQLEDLFGFAPTRSALDGLDFEALRPVLEAIARSEPPPTPPLMAPTAEKLSKNDISKDAADLLRQGRGRQRLVEAFFGSYPDPDFGEEIAQGFRDRYAILKGQDATPDKIFTELQTFAGGMEGSPQRQAAVLAVLSYFFDSCDIFEDDLDARLESGA